MSILIIVVVVLIVAALLVCCKVSGECARQEEKKDPCDFCVRWYECNGRDEDCPWKV